MGDIESGLTCLEAAARAVNTDTRTTTWSSYPCGTWWPRERSRISARPRRELSQPRGADRGHRRADDATRTAEQGKRVAEASPLPDAKYYYMFESGGQGLAGYRDYILGESAGVARGLSPDFGRISSCSTANMWPRFRAALDVGPRARLAQGEELFALTLRRVDVEVARGPCQLVRVYPSTPSWRRGWR